MRGCRLLRTLLVWAALAASVSGCATWRRPYRDGPPPAVRAAIARDSALLALDSVSETGFDDVRLNQLTRVGCHNCYDPDLLRAFADAPRHTGSAEIDVFDGWTFGFGGHPGAWHVRHWGWGTRSNCGPWRGRGGLATCLRAVAGWLADSTAPGMIVLIDKKQDWSAGRSPAALDSLLAALVPPGRIYTPRKLQGTFDSPRAAAAAGAWPSLRELRGRVIFVLTGPNARLHAYAAATGPGALAFVAPSVGSTKELDGAPKSFADSTLGAVAFYNFRFGRDGFRLGREIRARGFFSRTWYPLDDSAWEQRQPCKFVDAGINIVARYWRWTPFPSADECRRHPLVARKELADRSS